MRALLFLSFFLLLPSQAHACRYVPRPFDDALTTAQLSFIGTVVSVDGRHAVLKADKPIKGIGQGESLEVEIDESSCAIRFQQGQRWIYLGASLPSGSLLLQDANGVEIAENVKLAQNKFPDVAAATDGTLGGTLEVSCAPWDGAAFRITLDNGIAATAYSSITALEKKDGNAPAVFPADGKPERGHGQIVQCPVLKAGETSNTPCQTVTGTITMGAVNAEEARGRIDVNGGSHHVFKVKRVHNQVFCG